MTPSTNPTINQLVFYSNDKESEKVGIEVELEASHPIPYAGVRKERLPKLSWSGYHDGSLRNFGAEFISDPLPYQKRGDVKAHCVDLMEFITKQMNAAYKNSWKFEQDCPRTSIHVHWNAKQYTPQQVYSCCTAWWLLENLMVKYCGDDREGNLFCLRIKDAEMIGYYVDREIRNPLYALQQYNKETVKYAALNLATLRSPGTLEVRCMRGLLNPNEISDWVDIVASIFMNAATMTPTEIIDLVEEKGVDNFLMKMLPHHYTTFQYIKDYQSLVKEQIGLVARYVYWQNWTRFHNKVLEWQKSVAGQKKEDLLVNDALRQIRGHRVRPAQMDNPGQWVLPAGQVINPVQLDFEDDE